MGEARAGDLGKRAAAQTAYRVRLMQEALASVLIEGGLEFKALPEMTLLQEVGSVLEAEFTHDMHALVNAYIETHKE